MTIGGVTESRPLTPDDFERAATNVLESVDFKQREILLDALDAAYRAGQAARDAEIARLRADLDAKLQLDGQNIGKDIAEWMRPDLSTRVTQLEESIRWFLSLAREVKVGEKPEHAQWLVPDWQMTRLSEPLQKEPKCP